MNPLIIIGAVAIAVIILQIYYIVLHYSDITSYVSQFNMFRYGIDIVPNYIDPSTYDYNDTIVADVNTKRRCVLVGSVYEIVSSNGYAIDSNSMMYTYNSLLNCIIDMTNNYSSYILYNPCLINVNSSACTTMLSLL